MFVLFADTSIIAVSNSLEEIEYCEWQHREMDELSAYKSDMYSAPRYTIALHDNETAPYYTLPCYHNGDYCPFSQWRLTVGAEYADHHIAMLSQALDYDDEEIPF